jgi:hypothetical protein
MAKAGDKGIWPEDYLKQYEQPETHMRAQLDRGELRYTWVDPDGNKRASDDGGSLPPKGWWLLPSTKIDYERHSVQGRRYPPFFPEMSFVRVYPPVAPKAKAKRGRKPARPVPIQAAGVAAGTSVVSAIAKPALRKRGRRSSAPLVLKEAKQQLLTSDKALLERRGRQDFQEKLARWLPKAHPEARRMAAKTIGDHLSRNDEVRALLPKAWLRRR